MTANLLWYPTPAFHWTAALPIGNGRLGAMVFGGVVRDEIQLNEDTLWSGGPYSPVNPEAKEALADVRRLILAGEFRKAEELSDAHLMGRPYLQCSYQPAGRLLLDFGHDTLFSDYRRELDLATAVTTTSYRVGGTAFERRAFASAADGVLVLHYEADRPGQVSMTLDFVSEQPGHGSATDNALSYTGTNRDEVGIEGRLRWGMAARVIARGAEVLAERGRLSVRGADSVMVLLDIATSFRRFDDVSGDPEAAVTRRLDAAAAKPFESLLDDHIAAHRALFDRFALDLGQGPAAERPTDERIARFAEGEDPALAALYVQYGRYLAICSSRPGTQPANLQGIWNKEIRPPWGSKYTANINLQMNYWLADPANLAECFDPLITMAEDLSQTGAVIAREHYGARGWVLHHNTDLWRAAAPIDGAQWGLWPTGGAWLCAQIWDHLRYAGFPPEAVERVYPILRGASEFFLDFLVPLPGSDLLVTAPSVSPENVHPFGTSVCAGPAMDSQILRDLFSATCQAADRLGRDAELVAELERTKARLPQDRIGRAGQLQEWLEDWDGEVPEPDHRHVSHLYAAYPSLQIAPETTPDLAAAARRSLELRGDEATGWGIGWRICLWARLGDGEHSYDVLRLLLHPDRSYANLFDAHPPFQIDGNFGGAAGILEMLVQSDEDGIRLLPALPTAFASGSVRGLRARGGVELDMDWQDGALTALTVRAGGGYGGRIRWAGRTLCEGLGDGSGVFRWPGR